MAGNLTSGSEAYQSLDIGKTVRQRYRWGVVRRFRCPWLNGEVELTEERERHIVEKHGELLPVHHAKIAEVLADPDVIQRRPDSGRLFSRWYTGLGRGRHVVVAVVSQMGGPPRHWIVTAYMARRLPAGGIEWRRG
jgi:hypothetical protein